MSFEYIVLIAAVVFSVGCLGVLCLATAFLAWSIFRPRAASSPQPATAPAGTSPMEASTEEATAALLLAAYQSAKRGSEAKASRDLAVDMHAAEAETVKASMGQTLGPKGGSVG
ncbi:hypothetical protein [Paludisphaera rhizosphaerae]|uniref:hypothetical protein n=1 Tax=Paludisphaera rhizosphaerae TaxID=2711216 RepID=UPI0013ED1EED|nr:hypothetical protein [Paludisphaera rhizosphaerae]